MSGYVIQLWAEAIVKYGNFGSEMDDNYQLATELCVYHMMQEEG